MKRLVFKGGYGEHGRSCFLVKYTGQGRYYMVDCGIMDTDSSPYPDVTGEEMEKVNYVFLTHCHNDHAAAFSYIVEKGFRGMLIATRMTIALSGIEYDKILYLPMEFAGKEGGLVLEGLNVTYGRSGHCPGGVWYHMEDAFGKCFFSGDYQADTLLYACDEAKDLKADLAVVDCAHHQTKAPAKRLRGKLEFEIGNLLQEGKKVILPVPKYGRGLEMLCMLRKAFPEEKIKVDTLFLTYSEKMLAEDCWYRKGALKEIKSYLADKEANVLDTEKGYVENEFDILLLADTHLQQESSRVYAEAAVEQGVQLIITGRVKNGSPAAKLYEEGRAKRFLYPHHQSRGDMKEMLSQNKFKVTYPFHNPLREIYIKN